MNGTRSLRKLKRMIALARAHIARLETEVSLETRTAGDAYLLTIPSLTLVAGESEAVATVMHSIPAPLLDPVRRLAEFNVMMANLELAVVEFEVERRLRGLIRHPMPN